MTFENLLAELENGILTITINRPDKLNALNQKTVKEIGIAIKKAESNNSVKAIIITGSGQKSFVAGADINEFVGLSVEQGKALAQTGQDIFKSIETCSKPVIAAVNGFALGGGNELAMACHFRIAAENAKFGQPEVNLGITPGYAGTQRLAQLIGKGRALELLMTGESINASEAYRLGLVNYVVPADQLISKCEEILNKIKTKSPLAISSVIRCVNAYYEKKVDGNNVEINEFGNFFGSEDFKEGTQAFLNKRPAHFKGK